MPEAEQRLPKDIAYLHAMGIQDVLAPTAAHTIAKNSPESSPQLESTAYLELGDQIWNMLIEKHPWLVAIVLDFEDHIEELSQRFLASFPDPSETQFTAARHNAGIMAHTVAQVYRKSYPSPEDPINKETLRDALESMPLEAAHEDHSIHPIEEADLPLLLTTAGDLVEIYRYFQTHPNTPFRFDFDKAIYKQERFNTSQTSTSQPLPPLS